MFDMVFPDDGEWRRAPRTDREAADEELATTVVAALSEDPVLVGAEIQVAVQNRVVLLGGHAPTVETRIHAGNAVWRIPGVFDVCNLIRVVTPRWA